MTKRRKPRNVAMVSELKAGLSAYLDQVKHGEHIIVTERGRAMARIVPIEAATGTEAERLARLELEGRIAGPVEPGGLPPELQSLPRARDPKGLVLKQLLEDRRAGR